MLYFCWEAHTMSELAQPTPQSVTGEQTDYETAMEQVMAEVSRLNVLMQQDRADIERLRGEAWELRAENRALLAGMGARL